MRDPAILLFLLSSSTLIGCSDNFMQISAEYVVFELTMPADFEHAIFQTAICTPDLSACGRRIVDPELYDPDDIGVEWDDEDFSLKMTPTGTTHPTIEPGVFRADAIQIGPGHVESVRFNDLPFVPIDLPPRFQLTSPAKNEELSRTALNVLRIEWSPSSQGFPIHWKIFPVDNGIDMLPCDMLTWQSVEGEGEDTGVVDIPMDVFPKDLPAEGCPMTLRVARIKSFGLPVGVANGHIHTRVTDGGFFRLMP